jgi:isoleucyl-tRNA synthetase
VEASLDDYEPTRATRAIYDFVVDHLSNWYVRLCRRRFWKGEYTKDKIAAYQTLYECLVTVAKLSAPFAPFYMDQLFRDLNAVTSLENAISVHLTDFPTPQHIIINKDLEERMQMAQDISSLVLSLRKKSKIKVRQPLSKIMIPVLDPKMQHQLEDVKNLILSEVNVKQLEFLHDTTGLLVKKVKPDFKRLGPKYGQKMKDIQSAVQEMSQQDIAELENNKVIVFNIKGESVPVLLEDVEVLSEDIPGWLVASQGRLTVALDVSLTPELINEGIARELVNRIQQMRKNKGLELTDHIEVKIEDQPEVVSAVNEFKDYICTEILADELYITDELNGESESVEIDETNLRIEIKRI